MKNISLIVFLPSTKSEKSAAFLCTLNIPTKQVKKQVKTKALSVSVYEIEVF